MTKVNLHIEAYHAYLLLKIAKISLEDKQPETLMLVVYPLPTRGGGISDKAWEWTVYFQQGVWRCLSNNKLTAFHAFLINIVFAGIMERSLGTANHHETLMLFELSLCAVINGELQNSEESWYGFEPKSNPKSN